MGRLVKHSSCHFRDVGLAHMRTSVNGCCTSAPVRKSTTGNSKHRIEKGCDDDDRMITVTNAVTLITSLSTQTTAVARCTLWDCAYVEGKSSGLAGM